MKKVFLFLSAVSFVAVSCGSDDEATTNPTSDVLVKRIVTQQDDPEGFNYEIEYTYNGNKLVEGNYDDGFKEKYYYNGDLITKIEYVFDGDVEEQELFTYDSEGRLTEYRYQDLVDDYEDRSVFVFNGDNTITETLSSGSVGNTSPDGTVLTLHQENGEISKIVHNDGSIYNYTYDAKNSPFKNVTGYSKIVYASGGDFELDGRARNIVSIVEQTESLNYMLNTFQYNNADYPTSGTSVAIFDETLPNNSETMTVQFFYE